MVVGDKFQPYEVSSTMNSKLYVPESLSRYRGLSPGAKLAWARLARYQGKGGKAFPSLQTLASEIGMGRRQAFVYVGELEQTRIRLTEQKNRRRERV